MESVILVFQQWKIVWKQEHKSAKKGVKFLSITVLWQSRPGKIKSKRTLLTWENRPVSAANMLRFIVTAGAVKDLLLSNQKELRCLTIMVLFTISSNVSQMYPRLWPVAKCLAEISIKPSTHEAVTEHRTQNSYLNATESVVQKDGAKLFHRFGAKIRNA